MKKKTVVLGVLGVLLIGSGGWYYSQYGLTIPETVTFPWGSSVDIPSEITMPWGSTVTLHDGGGAEDNGTTVYVTSVAEITGQGMLGVANRYTGSVETQETVSVNFDTSQKLANIYVEEGEEISEGDPLFSYDTDDLNNKLQECDLELEEMQYTLQSLQEQLDELNKAYGKAKEEQKPALHIQILTAENSIRRQELNIATKQLDRAQIEKNITNSVVTSTMDGIIKSINEDKANGNSSNNNYSEYYGMASGTDDAFITILKTGDYRIKGVASEMTIQTLMVDQPVLVRPRADEERIYTGSIVKINTEPVQNNSSVYYYSDDSGGEASQYNFYIELNEHMDLMLGQHVLIELDMGQNEEKEGIWLPDYYIINEDDKSYVWKRDDRGYIEKAELVTGEFDEELMERQILEGLEADDYIAYPDEMVEEGARAVSLDEMDYGNDITY